MGNIEAEGKQSSLFPDSKLEKSCEEIVSVFSRWLTNLPRFQGARPDHVQVESSCSCFPRELVSLEPRHVTRSPSIGRRNWIGRYNNYALFDMPFDAKLRHLASRESVVFGRQRRPRPCLQGRRVPIKRV